MSTKVDIETLSVEELKTVARDLAKQLEGKTAYANELSSKLHIETNKHHAVIEERRKLEEALEKTRRDLKYAQDRWNAAESAKFFAMDAARAIAATAAYADYAISRLGRLLDMRMWNTAASRKEMRREISEYQAIQSHAISHASSEINVKITTDFLITLLKEGYTPEVQRRLDAMADYPLDFIHADRVGEMQKIVADKKAAQERKDKAAEEARRKKG